jgi:hypothetical protein
MGSRTVAFQKGQPKKGGRKKGTPNARTVQAKEALSQAFADLGGVPALVTWAKDNPTDFYRIWSKILPTEIKNADGETLRIQLVEEIVSDLEDPQPVANKDEKGSGS